MLKCGFIIYISPTLDTEYENDGPEIARTAVVKIPSNLHLKFKYINSGDPITSLNKLSSSLMNAKH